MAQTMMINLDNQYLNTNHVPKYEMNVIVIIQYIRTFVNVWKYLSIGLFSSYRFFSIQIATNANPEIIEFDLYEMMLQIIEEEGYMEDVLRMEPDYDKDLLLRYYPK